MSDSRSYPRFAVLSPALVVGESGVSGHCLVEDLSSGGARLSQAPLLVVGEVVRVLIQLPGRSPFSLLARVARRLASAPGAPGHTFAVWFSRGGARAGAPVPEEAGGLGQPLALREATVLVVDESLPVCMRLVQDLLSMGRRAIAVTTPLDAIEWLLDGGSHFDAAVVDVMADQNGGCDLLSFLADEYPAIDRIVMADGANAEAVACAQQTSGTHRLLAKPWQLQTLKLALR